MMEMCNIVHNDYDRISDTVMWLGSGATLKFNVDLYYNRKDVKNNICHKENFHKEYIYSPDEDELSYRIKITRNFSYYFLLDINRKDTKENACIYPSNIYFVIFNLKRVLKWFTGENGVNTVFYKKDGRLSIPSHPEPIRINLINAQYIEFEPAVYIINGCDTIGVNVFINRDTSSFFMTSDVVFSLYHMLSTCNMYTLAQNMLNYMGRPNYGTNLMNINVKGFKSEQAKNKSFFERVGAQNISEIQ